MDLVIDTNIIFSSLLKRETKELKIITSGRYDIYACQYSVIELFKYKEKLIELSGLDEEDILKVYYGILQHIRPVDESNFPESVRREAFELCKEVDEHDMLFVAATIMMDGYLWTGDKRLRQGLAKKGFTYTISTAELLARR